VVNTCEQHERALTRAIERCRERRIVIPTLRQMRDPSTIPQAIKDRLSKVGLWDVDPVNLFRITWKNEPVAKGGGFNHGNWIEFPSSLTHVPARIIGIVGKHFPTGAHKVGAAFGCLVPRLVTGQFDPTRQKAVWPSTGNFCRGGAFDCAVLACTAVAILPEGMSRERFEWLRSIGAEVIATPGCESNVKEIYDKCWEIRRTRPDCVIFNQFEEFGNAIWHYHVTGGIVDEIFHRLSATNPSPVRKHRTNGEPGAEARSLSGTRQTGFVCEENTSFACAKGSDRLAAFVSATGSAGTIAAGDFLKTRHPQAKIVAVEALQCPTLLQCGFGDHRVEGIGDKHVPWIHNVRNTEAVAAIDDEQCVCLTRLFNEDAGRATLERAGVAREIVDRLPDIGISSICNLVAAIKTAKYYEMTSRDVVFIPLTDSMELYGSRIDEYRRERGPYTPSDAERHASRYLEGISIDHLRELTYPDRKALHNLKYFTWVEQQQRRIDELRELWEPDYWTEIYAKADEWDRAIDAFNRAVGSS
jgi:cysteine synthase